MAVSNFCAKMASVITLAGMTARRTVAMAAVKMTRSLVGCPELVTWRYVD